MRCPSCDAASGFTEHSGFSRESHGETTEQLWLTCDSCGEPTTDQELEQEEIMGTNGYIKFAANVPQEVSLKYTDGIDTTGDYGPQVVFTLTDGRKMYLAPNVAEKLRLLKVRPGQKLRICKREVTPGNSRSVIWEVEPIETRVAGMLNQAPDLHEPYAEPPRIGTQLEFALRTVLSAAKAAEQYSQEIGHPVAFDKDDIRSMAITLVINQSRERAA